MLVSTQVLTTSRASQYDVTAPAANEPSTLYRPPQSHLHCCFVALLASVEGWKGSGRGPQP
jgi:hypothetical protein